MNGRLPNPHTPPGNGKPPLSDVQLAIFDFDGVVADSEVLSLATLKDALAQFGIIQSDLDVRQNFLGKSLETISHHVTENSPGQTAEGFADTWQNALFAAFRASLEPVPSILPMLDHLNRYALPFCVASSSTFERLDVALRAMGLEDRFRHIFSAEQVTYGKPEPDLFIHAAHQMNVPPQACLVIEDSPYGVRAATRAGMRSVGFVGGRHLVGIADQHGRLLEREGAQYVVHNHEDLIELGLALRDGDA